ncbi:hypothetical protein [Ereboglobus luteus]|uniref:Outer membrane protein beta-barrel domain-containing protein n=1 Tax=Ereboglobus luteus TaxID=1796921 RepID=A0A2U8E1M9_9BACT|nr:hypothetical protein [Ereboglobus luteus]AWI08594.1 hypothetical protein CKA38_04380 [Ereboglobus luteus]
MKLRTTLALVTAAVGLTTLTAQAQTTSQWEGSFEMRYSTRYVFRGDKKAGQSMQANFEFNPITGQDGFFVGGWANQPFASEKDFEFDLYGGYKYHWQGFEFSGGLIGYFYPEADNNQTDYTYEVYASANREILENWGATVTAYYDIRTKDLTFEAATGYRIPFNIEQFPASVDFSLFVGNSNIRDQYPDTPGPDVKDNYSYYGVTVSASVWFTKNLRATVGVQYGDTINRKSWSYGYHDGSDNLYGYAGIGLKW